MSLKTFTYKGELYIRAIPGKNLFRSTMVHEVVNRGDIFAVRVSDQSLTIIPGTSQVKHYEHKLNIFSTGKASGNTEARKGKRIRIKQADSQPGDWEQRTLFGNT